MRVNQYQARLGRCVKWHSIYYGGGGLGGGTLVILEYAHAGEREAAAALPEQKALKAGAPPASPAGPVHLQTHAIIVPPRGCSTSPDEPLSVGAARH